MAYFKLVYHANGFGPDVFTFPVDSGDVINLIYTPGMWPEENSTSYMTIKECVGLTKQCAT